MKKLMIMMLMLGAFASCTKNTKTPEVPETPEKPTIKLDITTPIYVNYKETATKADGNGHESAEYIVKNVAFVGFKALYDEESGRYSGNYTNLGLDEEWYNDRRDFENNRFVFAGGDAVNPDGTPGDFFYFDNIVFTICVLNGKRVFPLDVKTFDCQHDTVAYIPNAVMDEIRAEIKQGIAEGDLEKCKRVFNEKFVFVPCTGAEWRKWETKR